MPATSFTLYKLQQSDEEFNNYCDRIMNEYNSSLQEGARFEALSNVRRTIFNGISNYKVYYSRNRTTPDWRPFIAGLVTDMPTRDNLIQSFVFFIECQNNIFAITGGRGYLALADYKDYNFGLELLSKILEPNESVIKETSDRFLSGNRASGQNQFLGLVTLNSESGISNFFQKIDVFFTKEKVEELFGIEIDEGRKEYKFVARDSIRLGKSLTISEMDTFINQVCNLLSSERASIINNFYEVNTKDPVYKDLNGYLEEEFLWEADHLDKHKGNLSLLHFQAECDEFNLIRKTTNSLIKSYRNHISFVDILELFNEKFKGKIEGNENKNILEDFIKKIVVEGKIEDQEAVKEPLINLLDFRVIHNRRTYWLMNGSWVYLDDEFINSIDTQFLGKVTPKLTQSIPSMELKVWSSDLSEGQYNFSHHSMDNVYVLDKILVDNIELCDLLIITGMEVFLVHVKNRLDRDARVLSAQIMASMTAWHNALNFGDVEFFRRYYLSVINKINDSVDASKESTLSKAGRKFKGRFADEETFIDWVRNPELKPKYIFAYKPKGQDIRNPNTIPSTPAKIAMITLVDYVRRFDFNLEFLEIAGE